MKNIFTHHPSLTSTIRMSRSDQELVAFKFFFAFGERVQDLCNGQKRLFLDCNLASFSDSNEAYHTYTKSTQKVPCALKNWASRSSGIDVLRSELKFFC